MKNFKLKRIKNLINPLISIKWGHNFCIIGCCSVTLDPHEPTSTMLQFPKLLCKSQLETNTFLNNCSNTTFFQINLYPYRKEMYFTEFLFNLT